MDEATKTIVSDFTSMLIEVADDFLGQKQISVVMNGVVPEHGFFGVKKDKFEKEINSLSVEELTKKIKNLLDILINGFGANLTEERLEDVYSKIEKKYSPVTASKAVLPLIPANFLEKYRLQYLSKEELESLVVEKTKKLQKLNTELENKVAEKTADLKKLYEQEQTRSIELARVNKELLELDQRKSEFITIVAHQLRTPLSGLKWTLNMLVTGDFGKFSDEQEKSLKKCYEANERLIVLVEKILHANEIGLEKYELILTKTDIIELIKDVVLISDSYAKNKNISIEFNHIEIPTLEVLIDKEKMRDVFENLIDNAIKYSKQGGKISISLSKKNDTLECTIKDDGIGMPADQTHLIFSRFFRAYNARKVEPNGNGLGLFIIKGIVELHGGTIWFDSKENEGTIFHFTIPIKN